MEIKFYCLFKSWCDVLWNVKKSLELLIGKAVKLKQQRQLFNNRREIITAHNEVAAR